MLSEELKTYVDKCLAIKTPLDTLETGLRNAGWSEELILEAKTYFTQKIMYPNGVVAPATIATEEVKVKKPVLPVFLVGLLIFLFFLTGSSAAAYFVAMEKIPLANAALKKQISRAVFAVPFVPKTPKYVLNAAAEAHQKLFKNSYDLSAALESVDWGAVLGSNTAEIRVKGYMDLSDSKMPRFTAKAEMSQVFSGQVVKNDHTVYVKVDKIPAFLYTFLPITPEAMDNLLADWVMIDNTPLDTEARSSLESDSDESEFGMNKQTREVIERMMDEDVLPLLKMTTDEVDGFATNKLTFAPTMAEMDRIAERFLKENNPEWVQENMSTPSEYLSELTVAVWVDKKTNYVRKMEMKLKFKPGSISSPYPLSGNLTTFSVQPNAFNSGEAKAVVVLKMGDFGKEMEITTPKDAITLEEFFSRVQEISQSGMDVSKME